MKSLHHNKSFGLFIIRFMAGVILVAHGWMKLTDIGQTKMFFASVGIATFWVYVVALVEFLGGISFIIGFASKIAGGLVAIEMLGAVFMIHKSYGLIGPNSAELALIFFAVSLGIAIAGPGRYSLGSGCGCPVKKGTCPVDGGACQECGSK